MCTQGACLPGFYDRVPTVPGCETACEKSNGGVEICDGQDNDCDGVVDNNPMTGPLVCKSMGVCAGVTPKCMGQTGWVCTYPATHQDVEDMTGSCDGLDNDCDGRVDEPFRIGQACTVGSGACANPNGMWVCDNTVLPARHRCNGSPKPAGTETCNGLDDDCDGKVDELDSASNRTSDDKLIYLTGPGVTMFAYEATRYDANGTNYGFDSTKRPCSVAGPPALVERDEGRGPGRLRQDRHRLAAVHVGRVAGRLQQLGQYRVPVRGHLQRPALQRLGLHEDRRGDDAGDRRGDDVRLGSIGDRRRRAVRHERQRQGVGR